MAIYYINRLSCLFLCLLFFVHIGSSQNLAIKDDPLMHFKQGKSLYNQGLYAAAQDKFTAFQQQANHFTEKKFQHYLIESQYLYAVSAMKLSQSNAEKLLLTFVRKHHPDPLASKAMIEMADFYFNDQKYKQALEYYKSIDLYSLNIEDRDKVKFNIAYSKFVLKDFRVARTKFDQLKDTETSYYYPAIYYSAMSSYFLEDYDEALDKFKKVEESRRYSDVVPYYVIQIYFNNRDYDKVIDYGEDHLDRKYRYQDKISSLLGQAYFEKGEYQKALPYLQQNSDENNLTDEEKYQLAFTLYKAEKYSEATTLFKAVSHKDGKLGQTANFYLADALLKQDEFNEARVAFANASRLDANKKIKEEALFNYGKLSAELNYTREAVNALKELKVSSPYYLESQQILSDLFLSSKDFMRSIEILDEINDKSPEMIKTYQTITLFRGMQLYNDNRKEESIEYFDKSLENATDAQRKAEALYWKAQVLHQKGLYSESVNLMNQYFTIASTVDNLPTKQVILARYLQGYNYFKMKKYKVAEGNFAKVVKNIRLSTSQEFSNFIKGNILSDALLREGDALFKRNAYQDAINRYSSAIEADETNYVYATYQKSIIYGLEGDYVKKLLLLNEIVSKYPKSPYADEALLEQGETLMAQDKNDQAVKPLRQLVKDYESTSPLVVEAYLKLGLIAYNQGDAKAALEYYKKVFDFNPDKETMDEATTAIQEIYINDLGDPAGYVTFYEDVRGTSIKSSDKDSITYRVAESAYESGDYEKAIKYFSNYLSSYPNGSRSLEAHYQRAEALAIENSYQNALIDYEYVITKGPSSYYNKALSKAAVIAYNYTEDFNKAARYYAILEKHAMNEDQRIEALIGGLEAAYRSDTKSELQSIAQKISTSPKATEDNISLAQYYLGKYAYEHERYDEALSAFNQVTKYSSNELAAESRYLISKIYFDRKEYDIAESLANKSYKESSNYPKWVAKSLLLLSDILIIKDDTFNARAALEAIIDNYKEDESIIAEAQHKLNKIDDQSNKNVDSELLEMEE